VILPKKRLYQPHKYLIEQAKDIDQISAAMTPSVSSSIYSSAAFWKADLTSVSSAFL
jgi:hypothetical protein